MLVPVLVLPALSLAPALPVPALSLALPGQFWRRSFAPPPLPPPQPLLLPPDKIMRFLEDKGALFSGSIDGSGAGKKRKRTEDEQVVPGERLGLARWELRPTRPQGSFLTFSGASTSSSSAGVGSSASAGDHAARVNTGPAGRKRLPQLNCLQVWRGGGPTEGRGGYDVDRRTK